MKKGQTSVDAVWALNLVFIVYAVFVGLSLELRGETNDIGAQKYNEILCEDISHLVDAVYAGGGGTQIKYENALQAVVAPGIIMLNVTGGSEYFCKVGVASVNETWILEPGTHTIRNGGDFVEFK